MRVHCFVGALVLLATSSPADALQRRFDEPRVNGVFLDWCLEWGQKCGKPAADAFCRSRDFEAAASFEKRSGVGRSVVLGTGQPCRGPACDGFLWIECAAPVRMMVPRVPSPGGATRTPGDAPVAAMPADSVGNVFAREGAVISVSGSTSRDVFVDPAWRDEVVTFSWDVTKVGVAGGVVLQVSREPFPPPGEDLSRELEVRTLLSESRTQAKGELRVDFKELNRSRLTVPGRLTSFYVRVIPVATADTVVVGLPSNVVVVHRGKVSCLERPEGCCPGGDVCRELLETLVEVRLQSYVPPRFTVMGDHRPLGPNASLTNIVSDVAFGPPYPVRPGCRFSPTAARNKIRDDMSVLEEGVELATAMLHQWSSAYRDAKSFVADNVAVGVCEIVDDSSSCRDKVSGVVETGINFGLASLGIPPELPDLEQLREHGVEYLAAQAATYVVAEADEILKGAGVDDALREQLYERAYEETKKALEEQLDRAIPSAGRNADESDPFTWGHMEPAYLPHNAHLYVTVRVKGGAETAYRRLLSRQGPALKWPLLYIRDRNGVFGDPLPIRLPAFIPREGLVLPIEIRPSLYPANAADSAAARIPNTPISKEWLDTKFGLDGNVVTAQYNYRPFVEDLYINSDYDLFYATKAGHAYDFEVRSVLREDAVTWEESIRQPPGTVWDRNTGLGTRTGPYWERGTEMKDYFGRIDPAPRCDGRPTRASYH